MWEWRPIERVETPMSSSVGASGSGTLTSRRVRISHFQRSWPDGSGSSETHSSSAKIRPAPYSRALPEA